MLPPTYKHSASSGNTFMEDAFAFVWKWGMRNFGEDSARSNMGLAAENGAYQGTMLGLNDEAAIAAAITYFHNKQEGEIAEEEEAAIPGIVKGFLTHLRPLGVPLTYQAFRTISGEPYGLRYDIRAKFDFGYENLYVDTKATLKMPSEIRFKDVRQQALYKAVTGKPCSVLYATPKKSALYPVEDAGEALGDLIRAFRQIEALDAQFADPKAALKCLPYDPDSFYLQDEGVREKILVELGG